jgi:hypothetical protein
VPDRLNSRTLDRHPGADGVAAVLRAFALQTGAARHVTRRVAVDDEVARRLEPERAQALHALAVALLEALLAATTTTDRTLTLDSVASQCRLRVVDDGRSALAEDPGRRIRYRAGVLFGEMDLLAAAGRQVDIRFPLE